MFAKATTVLAGAVLATLAATSANAQVYVYPRPNVVYVPAPVYVTAPAAPAPVIVTRLGDAQLDQLTGPIALYPDPLIAQILPASTYPLEVVTASQWLRAYPQPTEDAINAQSWEGSIKALVHYPTVIQMMADRMDWTQSLGSAFQNQPADVMNSIQRMRAAAQAAGTLVTTQQQVVVMEPGAIRIVPVRPDFVYVPVYDPAIVYVRHREPVVGITFGVGFSIGGWLNMDCDWHNHYVATGYRWDGHHDHDVVVMAPHDYHPGPVVIGPAHPWSHDPARPVAIAPPPPPHRDAPDTRGWAPGTHPGPHGTGAYDRRDDSGHDSRDSRDNGH